MIRDLNINDFIYILSAARWTLLLSVLAIAGGGIVGTGILAARLSRLRASIRAVIRASLRNIRTTLGSSSRCGKSRLSATAGPSPERSSRRARYTSAIPPTARRALIW